MYSNISVLDCVCAFFSVESPFSLSMTCNYKARSTEYLFSQVDVKALD